MTFALLIGFGFAALAAFASAWRSATLWPVGCALAVNQTAGMAVWYLQQRVSAISFDTRAIVIVCFETLLAMTAFMSRMVGGSRLMIVVVALALLSVCATANLLLFHDTTTMSGRDSWGLVRQLCYMAECLCLIIAGRLDRARQDSRDHSPHHARLLVARDAYARDDG